jgi:hypothetical protein
MDLQVRADSAGFRERLMMKLLARGVPFNPTHIAFDSDALTEMALDFFENPGSYRMPDHLLSHLMDGDTALTPYVSNEHLRDMCARRGLALQLSSWNNLHGMKKTMMEKLIVNDRQDDDYDLRTRDLNMLSHIPLSHWVR